MITSDKNKIIKDILKLKDKKIREKTGFFYIEGKRFIEEIPKKFYIEKYIISENFYKKNNINNIKNYILVTDNVFKKISDTTTPQGIMAILKKPENINIKNIKIEKNSFFIMLDRITDAGNLGTIIRTAEAFGCSYIILSKECVDLYNSKVLRSTMGAMFHVPIIENCNLDYAIEHLKNENVQIICTHLDGNNFSYEVDFSLPTCVIVGNEANGVLDKYVNKSDMLVKIPMAGKVESINASICASIMLYESIRQKYKI